MLARPGANGYHAHLNETEDTDAAVRAPRAAGIARIAAVGMDLDSSRKTLELAARYPRPVLPAVGYHPWSIAPEAVDETLAFISEYLSECVALAEVGLDTRSR